jgi:predicted methyltransferase
MRRISVVGIVLVCCLAAAAQEPAPPADAVAAAVAHPDRPESDRQRDADRKPAEVLRFYGVAPGMKVADLMAGGGYFTELLSRLVGEEGHVYAQNNAVALKRFADAAMTERLKDGRLANVTRLDRELEDPGLPAGELDAAFLVLFYHDTYWMKVDRPAMNRQVLAALKPGGIYAVIDHHAQAGSGDRDVQRLHRVDAQLVKKEILAAGFELVEESDLLRHPEDDRTRNVFTPGLRGKTDQFIYKFRKPQ